ncbi:hypothetical protein [Myxococcus stipitatus]|uniref:hypothetical protein n=1 Tax=Myxococcus stipitatus TaxID=83455 RepID=UPI0030D55420
MKLCWSVLSALVLSGLLACGGTEAPEASDSLVQESSALVTCSTTCSNGSTVSCSGNTCSTIPGESVECDGFYRICVPDSACLFAGSACSSLAGKPCSPVGGERTCCINRKPTGNCYCMVGGTWACTVTP